jgi:hypothetical protein
MICNTEQKNGKFCTSKCQANLSTCGKHKVKDKCLMCKKVIYKRFDLVCSDKCKNEQQQYEQYRIYEKRHTAEFQRKTKQTTDKINFERVMDQRLEAMFTQSFPNPLKKIIMSFARPNKFCNV